MTHNEPSKDNMSDETLVWVRHASGYWRTKCGTYSLSKLRTGGWIVRKCSVDIGEYASFTAAKRFANSRP